MIDKANAVVANANGEAVAVESAKRQRGGGGGSGCGGDSSPTYSMASLGSPGADSDATFVSGGGGGAGSASFERPVLIHRAVLGSVERMFAILTEHYAGKWPFFLSPRQAMVVPVSNAFNEYAQRVEARIRQVHSSQAKLSRALRAVIFI